jgi:hypothetical protein
MRKQWFWTTRSSFVVALVVALLGAGELQAQEQAEMGPISVGSRVRFQAPSVIKGTVQGTVSEVDTESLLISTDDRRPFRVSRSAITQLEVAVGRRRNARKGLIIGAAVGATLLAIVAMMPKDSYCPPDDLALQTCLDDRSQTLAVVLPAAALEGAGIGALIKSDHWSGVPLERVHIGVVPTRTKGLGLALSMTF